MSLETKINLIKALEVLSDRYLKMVSGEVKCLPGERELIISEISMLRNML